MAELNNIRTVSVPSIGKLPLAKEPGTFTPSGETRDHVPGRLPEDGGYKTSSSPAKLDLNINLQAGVDMDAINNIKNEDVVVRLTSGQVYMMPQAFRAGEPAGFGEGESKLTLMSNTSERIA
ncbi:phage tail tube protein [Methylomonas rapida]|uniref:Phage tail tube protein n=1 Tax=Methylomonas rapida TaxID=2963939 RepID=A0ABY7GLV7_9GAMM|nr:phage tail tube protein [Methylomonas rapida]WAR43600.1 phage tail tube protein [Methylomonas rapida]WAR45471.1 phage tail tube protein [Methylomonas rapida]